MKDVPKFVRQRMAQPVGVDHPEANLLAAFAEGGLTMRERELVLSHLGKCATCRETLAVAMPEITAEHPHAAAAPSGTRWLRWPMLRWAGVGAAVVVVAAAVVIQSSRRSAEMPKISVPAPAEKPEQSKEPAKPAVVNEVAPVLADRVSRKEAATGRDARAKAESRTDKKKDAVAGNVATAPPPPGPLVLGLEANKTASVNAPAQSQAAKEPYAAAESVRVRQPGSALAGAGVAGVVAMEQKQQPATAPATPVPNANETVEVASESGVVQMQKAKSQDSGQSDLGGMKTARARPAANARATTAGVSVPVTGGAGPIPADSAAVTVAPTMKAALAIAPHWRLSSEGALERSTDAGRSWQFVRVSAPPPTLRSFSTVGRDIWAGGAGGALYHSADNGRTWARVTVKAGDAVLDSDIVRVEFTDTQHGALMTVAGETWTTGDAGLAWSVRR
ncbi:MAG: YCF48-related protein [Terriglobales bacterium]|jgi:hypothetical protein